MREDSRTADRLVDALDEAGLPVWRDAVHLRLGQDRRREIGRAISGDAVVFITCFSTASTALVSNHLNEELTLAIEQLRRRSPDLPWLIPVRFDDCDIPHSFDCLRDILRARRLLRRRRHLPATQRPSRQGDGRSHALSPQGVAAPQSQTADAEQTGTPSNPAR